MNAKRTLIFSAVFLTLTCSSAVAVRVSSRDPHLANIDAISLTIEYPKKAPVLKEHYWDGLKAQFEQKLRKANLNVSSVEKVSSKTYVSFIVRIELLKVPDANLFAVRVETAMARQMLLTTGSDHVFFIPIPLGGHGIRFVSEKDLPGVIENAASQHIDQFLRDYQATKSWQAKKAAQARPADTKPNPSTATLAQTQKAKYSYIASKSSKVFHKFDCRWVKRIKPENLVGYNSKDEVIKAGKRPCKVCNP